MTVDAAAARGDAPGAADASGRIPFRGLDRFTEEDAAYFFGREGDARIITANLQAYRLTVLYGASGVGKSSVLLAGVVAALRAGAVADAAQRVVGTEDPAPFAIAVVRSWIDPPLVELMTAIHKAASEALGGEELPEWRPGEPTVATLREWTERVGSLYVVLDQFEEYFLYNPPSDEPGSFDVELARIVNAPDLRVNVLLSLREDALALLDRFADALPNIYDNYLRIDHLDLDAAQEAIEQPVRAYNELHGDNGGGFRVERALVSELVASADLRARRQLRTDAGTAIAGDDGVPRIETPYLQLVLRRLWLHPDTQRDRVLGKQTLDDLGGPRKIVRDHLDIAMEALSPTDQELAAEAFRFLVTPSKTKIAHTAHDLAEFVKSRDDDEQTVRDEDVRRVLDTLCDGNRIVRRMIPPEDPTTNGGGATSPRYEIFHDVLADPIVAWRTERLAERDARVKHEEDEERVRAADAAARLHRKRAVFSYVLAVVATIGLIGAVAALFSAQSARDDARSATDRAEAERLAALSAETLKVDPQAAVTTSLTALRQAPTPSAAAVLREALPRALPLLAVIPTRDFASDVALVGADARYAAVAEWDGKIRFWSWRSQRKIREVAVVDAKSWSIAPVGTSQRYLFSAGSDAAVWDPTRCRAGRCTPLRRVGEAEALSGDGSVKAATAGPVVRVRPTRFCLPGSRCRSEVAPQEFRTVGKASDGTGSTPVGLRADGTLLAAGMSSGEVVVWRTRPGAGPHRRVLIGGAPQTVDGVTFSNGSTPFVAAVSGKIVRVWKLGACSEACRPVRVLRHSGYVYSADFSPDGGRLLTAADDGVARLWSVNVATGAPVAEFLGHHDVLFAARFGAGGDAAVTGGTDGTVRVWNMHRGLTLAGSTGWVNDAQFDPGGRRVAAAGADGRLRIYDLRKGHMKELDHSAGHGALSSSSFSPDGRSIVTTDELGQVTLWSVARCEQGSDCSTELESVDVGAYALSADFAPSGSAIAVTGEYGWKIVTQSGKTLAAKSILDMQRQKLVFRAEFSPDGRYLVTASMGGLVNVWEVAECGRGRPCKPKLQSTLDAGSVVYSAAFDPSGTTVVTAGSDRVARVWRWRDRPARASLELHGHTSSVRRAKFSDDGKRIVTAGGDGTTRVWSAASGGPLGVFHIHGDLVNSAEFAPGTRSTILSASDDGTARIYRCRTCGSLRSVKIAAKLFDERVSRPAAWLAEDRPKKR